MDTNTVIVFGMLIGGLTIAQIVDSIAKAWGQRGSHRRHRAED